MGGAERELEPKRPFQVPNTLPQIDPIEATRWLISSYFVTS
jgi:hypothetical protein